MTDEEIESIGAFASWRARSTVYERIEALLGRMTLEEKLGQISQYVPDQKEIYVTRGILERMNSEDELAGVIARRRRTRER